jgi:hypothetical protein
MAIQTPGSLVLERQRVALPINLGDDPGSLGGSMGGRRHRALEED